MTMTMKPGTLPGCRALLASLMVITSSVHLCPVFCHRTSSCQADHVTQYVMTFLAPGPPILTSPQDVDLALVLTNPSKDTPVDIRVDPPGLALTLQPDTAMTDLVFNGSAALSGSTKQERGGGLLVTACHNDTAGVLVQGTVKTRTAKSNAAFSVAPVASLGTDYLVLTHCLQNHCFLGVVATKRNTRVSVTLRLRHSYDVSVSPNVTYNGVTYKDGEVIEEDLDELQAMQVLCLTCDMSGSHVTASSPCLVLAGGEMTTIDNSSSAMDTVLEFLPPTTALGARYVLAKDTEKMFVAKVVALHADTIFTVGGECFQASAEGDTWVLPLPRDSKPSTLESSHPLLVALLITDWQTSDDVSMTVLLPEGQWSNETHHVVQPFHTESNHLFLVIDFRSVLRGCVRLNEIPLEQVEGYQMMHPVKGSEEDVCVVRVSVGASPHVSVLSCSAPCNTSQCTPFWGFVYGSRDTHRRGWAMPLGVFERVNPQMPQDNDVPYVCRHLVRTTSSLPTTGNESTIPLPTTGSVTTVSASLTTSGADTMTSTAASSSTNSHNTTSHFQEPTNCTRSGSRTTSTKPKYLCSCKHRTAVNAAVITPDQQLGLVIETSRQRNRKMSAPNRKVSETVIGLCGVMVLLAVLLVIVCADLSKLLGVSGGRFQVRRRRFH